MSGIKDFWHRHADHKRYGDDTDCFVSCPFIFGDNTYPVLCCDSGVFTDNDKDLCHGKIIHE